MSPEIWPPHSTLDLTVADRAGDLAGRADQQPLADRQIALEAAAHLRLVDRGRALEQAGLGNVDIPAVLQIGFDAAFDDQLVAGVDLARQRDLAADDQRAHVGFAAAKAADRRDRRGARRFRRPARRFAGTRGVAGLAGRFGRARRHRRGVAAERRDAGLLAGRRAGFIGMPRSSGRSDMARSSVSGLFRLNMD